MLATSGRQTITFPRPKTSALKRLKEEMTVLLRESKKQALIKAFLDLPDPSISEVGYLVPIVIWPSAQETFIFWQQALIQRYPGRVWRLQPGLLPGGVPAAAAPTSYLKELASVIPLEVTPKWETVDLLGSEPPVFPDKLPPASIAHVAVLAMAYFYPEVARSLMSGKAKPIVLPGFLVNEYHGSYVADCSPMLCGGDDILSLERIKAWDPYRQHNGRWVYTVPQLV